MKKEDKGRGRNEGEGRRIGWGSEGELGREGGLVLESEKTEEGKRKRRERRKRFAPQQFSKVGTYVLRVGFRRAVLIFNVIIKIKKRNLLL